jgi:mono/diheme cytochrome c family protein
MICESEGRRMPATGTNTWRNLLALGSGLLVGLWCGPGQAVEKDLTAKGEVLISENCARCHAIGKTGDSPHKDAPPFRTLSQNYPVTDLAESLAEGIVSGHPDMPIFVFSPHDVEAIIQYLESIQDVPSPPAEELAPPE